MTDNVAELRSRVARLKDEARKNEDAWKRAQMREMELLESEQLTTLLTRATDGLRAGYRLEALTLAVVDPESEIRQLLTAPGGGAEAFPNVLFADGPLDLPPFVRPYRPWLGRYRADRHERWFPADVQVESVALLPLVREHRLVGSLHMGSADPARFTRRHATDFLSHLGVIAAFALENTVNRARLLRTGLTDPLTGWSNRRYLMARLREELARCRRDGRPLACLMLDIDHFKAVNDRYGHLVGDEVLRLVAERIGGEVRGSDVTARYGGEEFVMLLPGAELTSAQALAERIRAMVAERPFAADDTVLPVTVSIGVAECRPASAGEADDILGRRLLAAADAALYDAKNRGRNVVSIAGNG